MMSEKTSKVEYYIIYVQYTATDSRSGTHYFEPPDTGNIKTAAVV